MIEQFAAFVQPHLRNPAHTPALAEALYELYFSASISIYGGPQPYRRLAEVTKALETACQHAPDPSRGLDTEGPSETPAIPNNFMALAALSPTFNNYLEQLAIDEEERIQREARDEEESIRQGAMGY